MIECRIEFNKNIHSLNGVLKVKEHLFLHQQSVAQEQFQYFQGVKKITNSNIKAFVNNISRNVEIANALDFKYLHIIFPAKPVVFKTTFENIGVEINSIVTKEHLKPSVLYPKSKIDDFEFGDTHHNDKGLFDIIKQAFVAMDIETPVLSPLFQEKNFLGDLDAMYGIEPSPIKVIKGFRGYNNSLIQKFDLSKYLTGNSGHIDYHFNGTAIIKKRLVLFGDSFFRKSLGILSYIFEEVIYFRNPYIIEDIVKVLAPDFVWSGNAERYLVNVPDSSLPKPYFLNYFGAKFRSTEVPVHIVSMFELLFSGRENRKFREWKNNNIVTISSHKQSNPYEITSSDLKMPMDINFCYNTAIDYEKIDINCSYYLIKLALKARPDGPILKKQYEAYKAIIETNDT